MTLSTTGNSKVYSGNAVTDTFAFPYKFTSNDHIIVKVDGVLKTNTVHYNLTGVGTQNGGDVIFTAGNIPPVGVNNVAIERVLPLIQDADPQNFDGNPADSTEDVWDTHVMMLQQVNDATQRTLKFPIDVTFTSADLPTPTDGFGIVWDGTTGDMRNTTASLADLEGNAAIVSGSIGNVNIVAASIANVNLVGGDIANVNLVAPQLASVIIAAANVGDIVICADNIAAIIAAPTEASNAAASALAASNSETQTGLDAVATAADRVQTGLDAAATAADRVQTGSDVTSAAASAAAAAAALESAPLNGITNIDNSDSPYTITSDDNGNFISVDTAAGDVVVTVPATLNEPFNFRIKKETGDANVITINLSGTEEFADGLTTKVVSGVGGLDLVLDEGTSPDTWKFNAFGASAAGNKTVDTFLDGVDYTAGTSTSVTLSASVGSQNNIEVIFGTPNGTGVRLMDTAYTLVGTTLTFDDTIPESVTEIQVSYGVALAVGAPADGTVSFVKLASGAIASVAEMVAGTVSKITSAANLKSWKEQEIDPALPKVSCIIEGEGGGTPTIAGDDLGAIASVTRSGTGIYQLTFNNAFANANYRVHVSCLSNGNSSASYWLPTTTTVDIYTYITSIGAQDDQDVSVTIFGELA